MNQESKPEGAENLTEKDRRLNELAEEFDRVAKSLYSHQLTMIRMADSEIPDEHAEVNTDTMAYVKEQLGILGNLISDIERADGIIDVKPEPNRLEDKK